MSETTSGAPISSGTTTSAATTPAVTSGGSETTSSATAPAAETTVTSGATVSAAAPVVPAAATATAPAAAPTSAVTKVATPTTKPAPTAQEIADSRQLSVVTELLGTYKQTLSAKVMSTKAYQQAAVVLGNVFTRVLDNPTAGSLEYVWTFFVDNAKTILQEKVALSGVEALAPAVRQRVELAYTLFRKATAGVDVADASKVNQTIVKNSLKSPKTVAYLSAQSKTVKTS